MTTLADTSLSGDERRLLAAFVSELRATPDIDVRAVWLFGSRARGEHPGHGDSDVDLLVLVGDASLTAQHRVNDALDDAARDERLEDLVVWFSVLIDTPEWLAGRRAIRSFFIAEIDRDKVVVLGEP